MPRSEQLTIDRDGTATLAWPGDTAASPAAERSARNALKAQIARLEHELSGLVAGGFPHISSTHEGFAGDVCPERSAGDGPRLLTLGELERARDGLATRVGDTRRRLDARAEFERASRMLLERIRLEPGRYKFARLPVADLGEGGCGVWEVRPRLGLIGMLAGWWHVKLSSGCPLAKGRAAARPAPKTAPRRAARPA